MVTIFNATLNLRFGTTEVVAKQTQTEEKSGKVHVTLKEIVGTSKLVFDNSTEFLTWIGELEYERVGK